MSKTVNKNIRLTPEAIDKLEAVRKTIGERLGIDVTPTQAVHVLINDAHTQANKS